MLLKTDISPNGEVVNRATAPLLCPKYLLRFMRESKNRESSSLVVETLKRNRKMTKKMNAENLVAEYLAGGGEVTKCPTRTVASKYDRSFRARSGFSRGAAAVCRLNLLHS